MKLSKIELPHLLSKSISAPIPDYVIQQRDAGRGQTLDYLSGSTVIDMLNTTFGHLGWSSEYPEFWIESGKDFIQKENAKYPFKAQVEVSTNALGERVCVQPQGPVAWAKCRLTITLERPDGSLHTVVKEAFGSKSIIGKQSEQEHIFKAAQTDALKKAASLVGIGLQLYRAEEEQAYYDQLSKPVVWTEEKQKESADWAILEGIAKENGWNIDDVDYYVAEVTDNQFTNIYTLPEAWLATLIEYLQSSSEEGDEE